MMAVPAVSSLYPLAYSTMQRDGECHIPRLGHIVAQDSLAVATLHNHIACMQVACKRGEYFILKQPHPLPIKCYLSPAPSTHLEQTPSRRGSAEPPVPVCHTSSHLQWRHACLELAGHTYAAHALAAWPVSERRKCHQNHQSLG